MNSDTNSAEFVTPSRRVALPTREDFPQSEAASASLGLPVVDLRTLEEPHSFPSATTSPILSLRNSSEYIIMKQQARAVAREEVQGDSVP